MWQTRIQRWLPVVFQNHFIQHSGTDFLTWEQYNTGANSFIYCSTFSSKSVLDFLTALVIGIKSNGTNIYKFLLPTSSLLLGKMLIVDPCPPEFTWILDTCLFYQPRKTSGTSYSTALNYCQQRDSELLPLESTQKVQKIRNWLTKGSTSLLF